MLMDRKSMLEDRTFKAGMVSFQLLSCPFSKQKTLKEGEISFRPSATATCESAKDREGWNMPWWYC
jgi:hypothetical protein